MIVVDNASTDDSVAAVRAGFPDVRLIEAGRQPRLRRREQPRHSSAASSELCLLLNSDTLVPAGALDALVAEHPRGTRTSAAVGPRIVDGDGRAELSFGRMMSPWNELRQKVLVRLHERGFGPAVAWVERVTRTPSCPGLGQRRLPAGLAADALAAGLFDERYFLYAEDVDFCAALRGLGKRIRFYPGAQIVAPARALRAASGPRPRERHYRQSQVRFYEKHHPAVGAAV